MAVKELSAKKAMRTRSRFKIFMQLSLRGDARDNTHRFSRSKNSQRYPIFFATKTDLFDLSRRLSDDLSENVEMMHSRIVKSCFLPCKTCREPLQTDV